MCTQLNLSKAVPLLASWGWDERVLAPTSNPNWGAGSERFIQLQNLRYATAYAIDRDFQSLLEFVAPSCENTGCFSPRILALLIRVCVEVESCFKSILSENEVASSKQRNINDFSVTENSHSLSKFRTKIHGWHEVDHFFSPFDGWSDLSDHSPTWYQAYGKAKHNVLEARQYATFGNLCDALSGLHVLLVGQFGLSGWGPSRGGLPFHYAPEYECVIGNTVEVRFPEKQNCRVVYELPRAWTYDTEMFEYS
jgi:hypothetical protein